MSNLGNKEIMAANINKFMESRGVTRTQLADAIDTKYTTLTDWINGKTYPRIDKIEKLANFFNISKSELVEDHVNTSINDAFLDKYVNKVKENILSINNYSNSQNLFIRKVNTESANNIFPSGSLVVIKRYERITELHDNDLIAIRNKDKILVNRFFNDATNKNIILVPDSSDPDHKATSFRYEELSELKIIGKVVSYTVILE